ncbi:MAG: UV DNA damage repair endonuclease UvsE [Chloroflexota bacterium]|nr:UV DNA damage repair endonuclease UvsE [Chloroflexota bacterium]
MIRRLGYPCTALGIVAPSNRTCRLANVTPERLREMIRDNLAGLSQTLRYNATLGIAHFRVHSSLIPFGSHPVNTVPWWQEFGAELTAIGDYVREQEMRLSVHPGQYVALSSPREDVLSAAQADLAYHTRLLDVMGLAAEHKLVIHGGGTYGDKGAAMARFVAVARALPDAIQQRLTLENDEQQYSAQDVLEIARPAAMPVVFDALHDAVKPSPDFPHRDALLRECFATWRTPDGPPDTHFSTQDPTKQQGAHGVGIDPTDFAAFAADTGTTAVDCMLEAKGKEQALQALAASLANGSR